MTDIQTLMAKIGADARAAAIVLATTGSERKPAALIGAADAICDNVMQILDANAEDQVYGAQKVLSPAMMDRLVLTEAGWRFAERRGSLDFRPAPR